MGKNLKGKELGKGLSQRKDGKYSARFVTGAGKRLECYFSTLQEAKYWLEEAKYNDRHGNIAASSGMTVEAWFNYWITEIKAKTVRPNTIRNYTDRYKKNIHPVIGSMVISEVKPIHCQKILNLMEKEYAGSTIYQALIALYNLFDSALENDIINKNPVTRSVKSPKKIEKKTRVLTIEEQTAFLEVAKNYKNYEQYMFILQTGCRTGEMIGLKWSDVDFKNRMITIERSMEYRYSVGEWRIGPPKSKSGYRKIPMTDVCYELLRNLREKRKQMTVISLEHKDFVFLNRKGTPTKNSTYDAHISKLTKKAGIENFSMHTLRHTFATRCIEAGMRPKTLQSILGHSSINITMNLYVHVTDEASKEEMEKFAKYDRALA